MYRIVNETQSNDNRSNMVAENRKSSGSKFGCILALIVIVLIIGFIMDCFDGKSGTKDEKNNSEITIEQNVEESPKSTSTDVKSDDDQYIFPDSSERILTEKDVEGMSKEEIRIALNEIYAKKGRMFNSEDLQEYFSQKDWYDPIYTPEEFSNIEGKVFNDIEKANIAFLDKLRQ